MSTTGVTRALDVETIRRDFPILSRTLAGDHPLVYLDSANTSQKPTQVVAAIDDHYLHHNANVARAMHQLGAEATSAFEEARTKVAGFIGAMNRDEIVFTKNASEGLNLAAHTLGAALGPGDEVVITVMEHHSNLVPWQLMCERTGATLRWFDVTDEGRLDLEAAERDGLINERTKVVSLAYVSNTLGTLNPVSDIAAQAHAVGATVVVDASQAVPQLPVDVSTLGADLLAFTGHKMCGPTGIGVLWGRYDLLAALPPFLGGGEMIEVVRMTGSTYAPPPHRFEAGTPPIAQAVGLGAAVDYLTALGMDAVQPTSARSRHTRSRPLRRPGPADPRSHRDRPGRPGRTGRRDLVHAGQRAPARRRDAARLTRDRCAGGAPLHPPPARAVRHPVVDPRIVLPVHDQGGDRLARRGSGSDDRLLQPMTAASTETASST